MINETYMLDDFRGHPDDALSSLNISAQITKPVNDVLVTFSNIDILEEIDGYNKAEIKEIIGFMEHVCNRLDFLMDPSPSLFDEGTSDDEEQTSTTRMDS